MTIPVNSFHWLPLAPSSALDGNVENSVKKVTEKVVEKALEKAAQETAEKAEIKAKRPDEWKGPTKVNFFIFVIDIDKIDDAAQSFTPNIFIRLSWNDKRLAHEGAIKIIPLEDIWNPHLVIANQGGNLVQKSLPEVVEIEYDGTVTYLT